jgi:hypothetical protein
MSKDDEISDLVNVWAGLYPGEAGEEADEVEMGGDDMVTLWALLLRFLVDPRVGEAERQDARQVLLTVVGLAGPEHGEA